MAVSIMQGMKHGLVSSPIQGMPRSFMPLSQLQYLLMPSMTDYSASSSWQSLPPGSLQAVRQQSSYPRPILRLNRDCLIIETLRPGRLLPPQVALAAFDTHNFAAASYVEAALGSLVSLKLRHLHSFLDLLFRSLFSQNR